MSPNGEREKVGTPAEEKGMGTYLSVFSSKTVSTAGNLDYTFQGSRDSGPLSLTGWRKR
ncbi:protein of unknown function [Nitrospina watsonii]|uniref:Uncharacterized protein n=1 Tax=Nitrospina watsonii TaxID=1323948 RepID=A0ABN8VW75_9BACT|nr:protein of unknown function [Nitrospina watsonii]